MTNGVTLRSGRCTDKSRSSNYAKTPVLRTGPIKEIEKQRKTRGKVERRGEEEEEGIETKVPEDCNVDSESDGIDDDDEDDYGWESDEMKDYGFRSGRYELPKRSTSDYYGKRLRYPKREGRGGELPYGFLDANAQLCIASAELAKGERPDQEFFLSWLVETIEKRSGGSGVNGKPFRKNLFYETVFENQGRKAVGGYVYSRCCVLLDVWDRKRGKVLSPEHWSAQYRVYSSSYGIDDTVEEEGVVVGYRMISHLICTECYYTDKGFGRKRSGRKLGDYQETKGRVGAFRYTSDDVLPEPIGKGSSRHVLRDSGSNLGDPGAGLDRTNWLSREDLIDMFADWLREK